MRCNRERNTGSASIACLKQIFINDNQFTRVARNDRDDFSILRRHITATIICQFHDLL